MKSKIPTNEATTEKEKETRELSKKRNHRHSVKALLRMGNQGGLILLQHLESIWKMKRKGQKVSFCGEGKK